MDNASYLTFGPDQTSFDDEESSYKITSNGQNVNLVYQSPIKSGDDIHSFLVKSNNSGKTFEKRIKLGNTVEGYSEFSPRIVSSSNETIHVMWISGKIDVPLPTDADTFYSRISKTGKDLTEQSLQIYASPLKQFQSGIPVDEIQCNERLLKVIKKSDGNPVCVKPKTKSELVQRNWIQLQFSFCGADGFDSKYTLNKSNSTHFWDENYCKWWPAGYDPSLHQEERKQLQMKKILDHCNHVSLELKTDQPSLQYENETHIITSDTCEWRKMHLH